MDDVTNIGAPISEFSAFDFENSLGFIKSIVKSPSNPIAEIQRKLLIFHTKNSTGNIPLVYPLGIENILLEKLQIPLKQKLHIFTFINVHGFKTTTTHPDNVVCITQ